MPNWRVEFLPQAKDEFDALDGSVKKRLKPALRKLEIDPIGYGDPLGNRQGRNLTGLYSLRGVDRGVRIIYTVFEGTARVVLVVAVAARKGMGVHKEAHRRWMDTEAVADELTQLAAEDPELFEELLRRFLG